MRHSVKTLGLILLLVAGARPAAAFSMLGPFEAWQTVDIGYQLGADLGGPMNLGEEYRWNTPEIFYAFDPSFIDYFGERGVEEVNKAIAILNDLPNLSKIKDEDLSKYPLDTRRFNYQATALNLLDLKTYALAAIMEQLGAAAPDRFVWTLRSRVVIANVPYYTVISRSFDPFTWQPSRYVNATMYTYQILQTFANPDTWEAVEIAVDPLRPSVTAVSSVMGAEGTMDFRGVNTTFSFGMFFDGLTQDDVAELRYVYRKDNYNVENLPTNAVFGVGGDSPWGPAPGQTGTNIGGTNAGGVTNFVITGLRLGINNVKLKPAPFDSQFGQFVTFTNFYTDSYVTNGVIWQQGVARTVATPDILFAAADLGVNPNGIPFSIGRTVGFINDSALNSIGGVTGGPGEIAPPSVITFSRMGPWLYHITETAEEDGVFGVLWGSFDGTTNAPVIYPSGTSIQEAEQRVLSAGGSPWRTSP